MFTIFLQLILSDKLLLAVTSWQKNNSSDGFRLKTRNNLPLKIYCKKLHVDVALLKLLITKNKKVSSRLKQVKKWIKKQNKV